MSEIKRTWIAPIVTGTIAAVLGSVVFATFYPNPSSQPSAPTRTTLPAAFVTADAPDGQVRNCYAIVSECLKERRETGRPRTGCEVLPYWFQRFQAAHYTVNYSAKIGGCIVGMAAEAQNEWMIFDLQGALGDMPLLFHCDRNGVDNVIVSAARKLEGKLFESPHRSYTDDAQGGLPRTLKTPEQSYSRKQCQTIFQGRLSELAPSD